jgi:hypothetical protein
MPVFDVLSACLSATRTSIIPRVTWSQMPTSSPSEDVEPGHHGRVETRLQANVEPGLDANVERDLARMWSRGLEANVEPGL